MNLHIDDRPIIFKSEKFTFTPLESSITLTEFMDIPVKKFNTIFLPRDRIVCADGFSISVQSSCYHLCTMKNNDNTYNDVELGFPSHPLPKEFLPFKNDDIYCYVPFNMIKNYIESKGGIIGTQRIKYEYK